MRHAIGELVSSLHEIAKREDAIFDRLKVVCEKNDVEDMRSLIRDLLSLRVAGEALNPEIARSPSADF